MVTGLEINEPRLARLIDLINDWYILDLGPAAEMRINQLLGELEKETINELTT